MFAVNRAAVQRAWVVMNDLLGEDTAVTDAAVARLLEALNLRVASPDDCPRCQQPVQPGTRHVPFNGNQMFACESLPA